MRTLPINTTEEERDKKHDHKNTVTPIPVESYPDIDTLQMTNLSPEIPCSWLHQENPTQTMIGNPSQEHSAEPQIPNKLLPKTKKLMYRGMTELLHSQWIRRNATITDSDKIKKDNWDRLKRKYKHTQKREPNDQPNDTNRSHRKRQKAI